jgi:pyruvate/2-oxoglutarate dehydrogenase complex dihydrolipoamide dehydrogenase (E3) component
MEKYDYILIGTGQATGTILPELLQMKKKVAVVEEDRVGGLCVNYGCTPTKSLVAAALKAHHSRTGMEFGVETENVKINFPKVMERVNSIRNSNSTGFENWLKKTTDFFSGHGKFQSDHVVTIGDTQIYGETILIHTGTSSMVPNLPGLEKINYLDNRSILELKSLPEHLIVIGGSYIALEFAQIFRRFGSKVSIIQRSNHLVTKEDEDIAEITETVLKDEGIEIYCGTKITGFSESHGSVSVKFDHHDNPTEVSGTHLLIALGRKPNSENLGLENIGVETDKRGFITVDDNLKTTVENIYALGDINGRGAFTHTSVNDGQIFINNLKGGDWKISDRIPIHAMFIDPPLARVGITEKDAKKLEQKVLIATRPMARISRAYEKGETYGLIKLIIDEQSEMILGATVFGVGGDEIINLLAVCIQNNLTYKQIQRTVFAHPTVSELIPWIFDDLKPIS